MRIFANVPGVRISGRDWSGLRRALMMMGSPAWDGNVGTHGEIQGTWRQRLEGWGRSPGAAGAPRGWGGRKDPPREPPHVAPLWISGFQNTSAYISAFYIFHCGKIHTALNLLLLSVLFSLLDAFTLFCVPYHHPSPEPFASCKTEALTPLNNKLPVPSPQL